MREKRHRWRSFCDALFLSAMDARDKAKDFTLTAEDMWSPPSLTLFYLTPRAICEAALEAVRADKPPALSGTQRPSQEP